MKSIPRLFTLDEANALLPQIEALLQMFLEKKEAYERLHDVFFMHELLAKAAPSGGGVHESSGGLDEEARQLDHSVSELEHEIDKIRSFGCIVRNLDRGWIDFLGRSQNGEQIYFCWKRGEKSIVFYHPVNDTTQRLPF